MHLSSTSLRGEGPWADVRTLVIVHFKVLVFNHPRGSPAFLIIQEQDIQLI